MAMNAPLCAPPDPNPKKPAVPTPSGACDCHSHVFGPAHRFPYAEERSYTPPDAPMEMHRAMLQTLGFDRGVLVQGNAHGTDNAAMLDALERDPARYRGVAVVDAAVSDAELRRMADLGVKGARFDHLLRDGRLWVKGAIGIEHFEALHDRIADLGWHMQLWMDCRDLPDLWPRIEHAAMPIVVDHMGRVDARQGPGYPGFGFMTKLLGEGKLWVKLSGTYRITENWPDYPEARPFHEALLSANPEHCVWGTDWPHPWLEARMPNDGALLDLFNAWTPDEATRQRVLVENPARLYGFDSELRSDSRSEP
jgi:predicted TIM-barrel fold metal-dependent hydrolase